MTQNKKAVLLESKSQDSAELRYTEEEKEFALMYKYWPWLRRMVSGDEKLIFITQK